MFVYISIPRIVCAMLPHPNRKGFARFVLLLEVSAINDAIFPTDVFLNMLVPSNRIVEIEFLWISFNVEILEVLIK